MREMTADSGMTEYELIAEINSGGLPCEPRDRKKGVPYRVLRAVYFAWKEKKVADGLRALGIEPAQAAQPEGVAA